MASKKPTNTKAAEPVKESRRESIARNLALQLEARAIVRAENHKESFLEKFRQVIRDIFPNASDAECHDVIREVLDQEAGETLICLEFTCMNSYLAFVADKKEQVEVPIRPYPGDKSEGGVRC